MIYLGLDLSTSITGATLLDEDGSTLLCEAWDTRNKKQFPTLIHKADYIRNKILELEYSIDKVFIEKPLMFFSRGGSSANVMAMLQNFNGMVSWICWSELNIEPEHILSGTARKLSGLKIPRGQKAKEVVLQYFLDNGNEVEYTKHGNPKPGSYDRADSWVVAKAGYRLWKEESKS